MLTSLGLSAALILTAPAAAGPSTSGCAVEDSHGRCLVVAIDPGRHKNTVPKKATQRAQEPRTSPKDNGRPTGPTVPRPPLSTSLPTGSGSWGEVGGQALANVLAQVAGDALAQVPAAPGAAPVPVPVTELAQRAIDSLDLAPPAPRTSVSRTGFVGVPLWLWIGGGAASTGPVSATATVGAAQVTATARLSRVEWSMGPPGEIVRCAGPGTPWTGQDGPSPDCGYTFAQRSLPERTGGAAAWKVTATSVWTVTWSGISAGAPVAGQQVVSLPAQTTLPIGEIQVLVGGGNR